MSPFAYIVIECILFGSYTTFATFYSFSVDTTTTTIDSRINVIITPVENDLKNVSYIEIVPLSVSGQFNYHINMCTSMAKKCGSGKDKNGRINRSMLHMIYFIWVTFNLVISFRFCIRLLCKSKVNVLMVNIMFIEMVSALDLNTTYSSNHSLYAHLSPYYIRSNIDIQAAATLHIENGVDLIFEGNYAVNVYGAMRISEELFHAIDPQQENGLANSSAFTKIIANNTLTRAGQINIITNSNSSSSFFFQYQICEYEICYICN
eukprot:331692_1